MSSQAAIRVAAVSAQAARAPAFRVRALIPAEELASHGVEIVPFALFSPRLDERFHTGNAVAGGRALLAARRGLARRMREAIDDCETTLVQRQVDILPCRRLERIAMGDRRLVLDVDDAVWLDAAPQAGGRRMAFLKGTAGKIGWLAARADHVIAGNDYLAEWLENVASRVSVVPSLVATEHVQLRRHAQTDRVTLGWIGSPSTSRYLANLRPVLSRLVAAAPDITWELRSIGAVAPDVPGIVNRSSAWDEAAERDLLAQMDIGLMPLPDDPWTRGKCAYKALVYMSAGIPVVADDVGVTASVVGPGLGGFVVRTQADWIPALVELARDPELRARMGIAGRRRVEADYSTRVWGPRLAAMLRGDG